LKVKKLKTTRLLTTAILAGWLLGALTAQANQKRYCFSNKKAEAHFGESILLEGDGPQIARFEKWLDRIAQVPKGYATLKAIAESGHELTLRHATYAVASAGRTLAPMSADLTNGIGTSVTILFSAHIPDAGSHMVYNAQRQLIEYTAIQNLYHELAHAMHMMKGSWRYFASERQAIEEENAFRRDLARMHNIPVTERWRKNGVLIHNVDDIFVVSEWYGPSVIKMPEPLYPPANDRQTAAGAATNTSQWQRHLR
jgi:hypothetical protein